MEMADDCQKTFFNSSQGSTSLCQQSCYDVIGSHERYVQDRVLLEEHDVFKFNCEDIKPNEYVSLQLVANTKDVP